MTGTARTASGPPPPAGWHRFLLGAMVLAYGATYSTFAAILFRYYLYTGFDLAIFAQAVDGLLHGRIFSSIRGMAWLGDHASLILILIAPLYAIARHPLTLLAIQAVAQGLGALPVYALARRELGHNGLALVAALVYLLQPALGYSNLYEFHPELLATAPLLAAFYYLRCGRSRPTLIWSGLSLLCREDVALVVAMLALYALILRRPGGIRLALGLAAAAALSAFVSWGVLRPAFSHGEAEYGRIYGRWGDTLGAAALHMLRDPLGVAVALFSTPGVPFDTQIKQQFYLTLFLPLGLLSLLSPLTLAVALPVLMEHMLSWRTSQHTILCQYTALQIPFVTAAAVIGTRNLLRFLERAPAARRTAGARAVASADPQPHVSPRAAAAVALWMLAASLGCQLWFGPLLSSGKFFITGTRGRVSPTPEERTVASYRDGLLARVPRGGAVVASFEFLDHLSARDSVHSLHHLMTGSYTFSSRPYPAPAGVTALLADLAATNIVGVAEPGTAARLQAVLRSNRLAPVAEAGDLVLFERDPAHALGLVTVGGCPDDGRAPIVFDGQLAYVGGAVLDTIAPAGGTVALRTCWRRTGQIDRFFRTQFDLVDASGRSALTRRRDLGYLVWPPHAWPQDQPVREDYRLILDDDLATGDYGLVLRVGWRMPDGTSGWAAGDPGRDLGERGIPLGRVRIRPR